MALIHETNIAFSSQIQSQKPYNSIIINCYASVEDVYSKIISEKEVAVFGEYKVLVFYRQPNGNRESSYKSFTLRKNFCEVILFDLLDKGEIKAELNLQPSCKFNYVSKSRLRSFWNIEVSGVIKVSCVVEDIDNTIKNNTANSINSLNTGNSTTNANGINTIENTNSSDAVGVINLSGIVNTINSESTNSANTTDHKEPKASICSLDNSDTSREDTNSQDDTEYNISSRVWQFEDSESTKVEELMYMDFEKLKKIDKD